MKKGRKDLIKRLHADSHPSYKGELEKEFPKLFKDDALVVGKWYYYNNWLIEYAGKTTHLTANYGFDNSGNYFYDSKFNRFGNNPEKWVLATEKEVEQALIKEAKRKGFKEGVCFIPTNGTKVVQMACEDRWGFTTEGKLLFCNYSVFEKGVFAKIITETITRKQFEEAKEVLLQYSKQ